MIHLVTAADYPAYRSELDQMHRLRYRVFRERLGWNVATIAGRDRDQFDDLKPIYLLATDERGNVVGSWRFLFTTGPYMLRDTFPQLLEGRPAPHDIGVWEGSRFALERSAVKDGSLATVGKVAAELLSAVVETCIAAAVRGLITVYDCRMARLLHRMGCPPRQQSQVHEMGRSAAMAGCFDMTTEVLDNIERATRRRVEPPEPQPCIEGIRPTYRAISHGVRHVRQQAQLPRFLARIERDAAQPPAATALPRGGST